MITLNQLSFSGGELAPSLYGRKDTVKYSTGLKKCRNFMVMRHGGVSNRPGTYYVCEVANSSNQVRLIPFIFNSDQTYVLEFGNQYIRVIQNGVLLKESAKTITGITNDDPAVITSASHGYSNGDEVYISGVVGMTEINTRHFKVANVDTNTFEIKYMDGSDVDSSEFGEYDSGGTCEKIYELESPYITSHVRDIKFVQSGDVITLTHNSYAQIKLSRLGHTSWSLDLYSFTPNTSRPTGGVASAGSSGSNSYRYRVTAIANETFEESLPGYEAEGTITAITKANPAQITVTSHGYSTDDELYISGVGGMVEITDGIYSITKVDSDNFTLNGVDSSAYTTFTSGGSVARTYIRVDSAAEPSTSNPHSITWSAVSGAREYNVYRALNGVYGFIGIAGETSFSDVGTSPDVTDTPPSERNPFSSSDDYPGVGMYVQQRLVFANTNNNTEKVDMSRTGQYNNFTKSSPTQDDDAISFTIAGRQVNSIQHLIDINRLIILTSGGEWAVEGNGAGIITPFDINLKQYSFYGSSSIRPIIIGNNVIFVQARGSIIRDLKFDNTIDGYMGNDLTIFSSHLFDGYTIFDMDYQQSPQSIIWVARSDGKLIGLTYIPEHEMVAWHRHDFDGFVENVVCVPEGNEDAVYMVIKRTIDSKTVRYIERMTQRRVADIVDYIGMDCALTYDGRNTDTNHTMTLSGGDDWTYEELLTITSSESFFSSDDVGNSIWLYNDDGNVIRFSLTGYTSATVMTGTPHKTVSDSFKNVAISNWSRAVDQISGLWHLEGKAISILGSGFVLANPNNPSYNQVVVTNGTAQLDDAYPVIHAGLPITSDLETLDIDVINTETMTGKAKLITTLNVQVESTRDMWAGSELPEVDNSLTGLTQIKIRNNETYDDPIRLQTGVIEVKIEPRWDKNGSICIRNTDPLPISILAIAPSGLYPIR